MRKFELTVTDNNRFVIQEGQDYEETATIFSFDNFFELERFLKSVQKPIPVMVHQDEVPF